MKRDKLIELIQDNLLSTNETAILLDVTKTRLNKIKELKAIVRGYYLKSDVMQYINSEEIQNRRLKYLGKEKE